MGVHEYHARGWADEIKLTPRRFELERLLAGGNWIVAAIAVFVIILVVIDVFALCTALSGTDLETDIGMLECIFLSIVIGTCQLPFDFRPIGVKSISCAHLHVRCTPMRRTFRPARESKSRKTPPPETHCRARFQGQFNFASEYALACENNITACFHNQACLLTTACT